MEMRISGDGPRIAICCSTISNDHLLRCFPISQATAKLPVLLVKTGWWGCV
jgi:hypothetical protein